MPKSNQTREIEHASKERSTMKKVSLSVFAVAMLIGVCLSGAPSAIANPTCECDVLCARHEQRCLDLGGTVSQCADLYDSCFISCGDTWPCGPTGGPFPPSSMTTAQAHFPTGSALELEPAASTDRAAGPGAKDEDHEVLTETPAVTAANASTKLDAR